MFQRTRRPIINCGLLVVHFSDFHQGLIFRLLDAKFITSLDERLVSMFLHAIKPSYEILNVLKVNHRDTSCLRARNCPFEIRIRNIESILGVG